MYGYQILRQTSSVIRTVVCSSRTPLSPLMNQRSFFSSGSSRISSSANNSSTVSIFAGIFGIGCAWLLGNVVSAAADPIQNQQQAIKIIFPTEDILKQAFLPHTPEEVIQRITSKDDMPNMPKIQIELHPGKIIYTDDILMVYIPSTPFIEHHLVIALNRKVQGLADVTREENIRISQVIKKICIEYQKLAIGGPVIVQYDRPQNGHGELYAIELLPPPSGVKDKDMVEKVRANTYMLFRDAKLTPLHPIEASAENYDPQYWSKALNEFDVITSEDQPSFQPIKRKRQNHTRANYYLLQHVFDYLQDHGAVISGSIDPQLIIDSTHYDSVQKCVFDDPGIIQKQLIYENDTAQLLYNIRKGVPGCNFLILPKSHIQEYLHIPETTLEDMRNLRASLVRILKKLHPDHQIISFLQDSSTVGQTVPHAHEQIISFDAKTFPLTWSLSFLDSPLVDDTEMSQQTKRFRNLLEEIDR